VAAVNYSPADSVSLLINLLPLLSDPARSVRIEAASRLLTFKDSAFNEFQLAAFRNAVEEYRESLGWAADFPAGRYNLGNYYSKMNDRPKAMENYAEALALDRLFYPARINLGIQSYTEGKTELAERLFNEMIRFHPEMIEGYYYLALLYAEQNRNSEAIALLESAVSLPDANPRIFYNLGLLYQSTGQEAKSGATFEKGLVLDPCNFDLLYALFVFHLNRNDRTKASIYVEKLIQCYPEEAIVKSLYRDFMRGA
jgi:tetratricopeptide (TPR) repeat protein